MQTCFSVLKSYSGRAAGVSAPVHSIGLLMKGALIFMAIQGYLFKLICIMDIEKHTGPLRNNVSKIKLYLSRNIVATGT